MIEILFKNILPSKFRNTFKNFLKKLPKYYNQIFVDYKMTNTDSFEHLNFFMNLIKIKKPFLVIRPNDGEYMILEDINFTNIDFWTYKSGSKLKNDLFDGIKLASSLEDGYVGIPCKDCWDSYKTEWYIKTFNLNLNKNLTYGNLVCNYNWKFFTNFLIENKISFYYIGPGKLNCDFLLIKERFFVDEKQIERWDFESDSFLKNVYHWVDEKIKEKDNVILFMISAGPLSKIIAPNLFQKYKNNQFLDCGSSLDFYLKNSNNRPYTTNNNYYSRIICDFTDGHKLV